MSTLRIIILLLIILLVGIGIHWKRHWIDKMLQKTWTTLILLIVLIVALLLVSFFIEFIIPGHPLDWQSILRVYGMFSQTLSAYSPGDKADANTVDNIYHLLLSVIGAFLFAGILISAFNNVLTQRIDKINKGLVDYNFYNHAVIIGANDSLLTIIRTITKSKGYKEQSKKIIIVTSKSYDELIPLRSAVNTKTWDNIFYIKADILDPVTNASDISQHFLKRACIEYSREIYILSDSQASNCDVDNSRIITSIYFYFSNLIKDRLHKIQHPESKHQEFMPQESKPIASIPQKPKPSIYFRVKYSFEKIKYKFELYRYNLSKSNINIPKYSDHKKIFKYLKDHIVYKYNYLLTHGIRLVPINCYLSFSNLAMTLKVCRKIENIEVSDIKIHQYIRIIPFDFNMMLAAKAWRNTYIPETIDIIGFSDIGVAMTKYLMLAAHNQDGRHRQINVYLTHSEIEAQQLFSICYDYKSIPDINLKFIEIQDYTDYIDKAKAKSRKVVLCGKNLEKNITITYALQHDTIRQKILVYSSTPVLSGVFSDSKGGDSDSVIPFGNHNQSLDITTFLNESSFIFTVYEYLQLPEPTGGNINQFSVDYFHRGFDLLKWRLMTLRVLLNKNKKCTREQILNQQIAAAILGGYLIAEEKSDERFITRQSDLDKMLPVIEEARLHIDEIAWNKYNLYPLSDEAGRLFLYAPLCNTIAEVTQDEFDRFYNQLNNNQIPDEIANIAVCEWDSEVLTPDTTPDLTILINQRCNFSCKYCYSANGRSNAELPELLFEPLVKWFVNPEKRGSNLNVTFSGGGEPTLSMSKVCKLINMMRKEADRVGVSISFGMVCNGSGIKDEYIEFIRDNFSNLVISFDVIQKVHDEQRSHFPEVAATMRALVEKGVKFGLRSTITNLNVNRMEEMVDVLHRDFPNCRSLAMEAVMSTDMWKDSDQLNSFYSHFVENYFKAQRLADEYGISLGNTIELSADGLRARACEGKVVVTPDGCLTACSRIATEGDNFFSDFIFGRITENGVTYDSDKYQEIAQIRADNFEECHSCFAKYHCGGGCMLIRMEYPSDMMAAHCDFTRRILKHKIIHELD